MTWRFSHLSVLLLLQEDGVIVTAAALEAVVLSVESSLHVSSASLQSLLLCSLFELCEQLPHPGEVLGSTVVFIVWCSRELHAIWRVGGEEEEGEELGASPTSESCLRTLL
jgi:hypothetical protein